MTVSAAQKRATAKYEKEKYDKILLRLPKGMKEEIQMCTTGSVNNFIFEAIREKIDKENSEELPAFMLEQFQY